MYKKGILVGLLVCSMSMTGCIVINTGKADNDTKESQNEPTKQVIIHHSDNNTSNNSNTSNDTSREISRAYEVSEYVFYDSDTRYLTSSDLKGLSSWELKIARNEIYARYGYSFEDEELRRYFLNKSWYEEDSSINKDTWSDDCLNEYEKANRNLIVSYEEEMGYR